MLKDVVFKSLRGLRFACIGITAFQLSLGGALTPPAYAKDKEGKGTVTPIKHVIVIVGENRTFDHLFATYKPKEDETVDNLLSKKIIKEDGTPGRHFSWAKQYSADITGSTTFEMSPTANKVPYATLPAPLNGGPTNVCINNGICTLGDATSSEDGLSMDFYQFMLTGGTGLTGRVPDSRISGV